MDTSTEMNTTIDEIKTTSAELVMHEREVARLKARLIELVMSSRRRPAKPSKSIKPKASPKAPKKTKPKRKFDEDTLVHLREVNKRRSSVALVQTKENLSKILNGKPQLVSQLVSQVPNAWPTVQAALKEMRKEGLAKSSNVKDNRGRMTQAWQAA